MEMPNGALIPLSASPILILALSLKLENNLILVRYPNTMKKPIALQLYTLRDHLATDWEATLEKVADAGFIGVETAGFGYAPSQKAVIDKLNDLNLTIVAAHSGFPTRGSEDESFKMMEGMDTNRIICAGTGRDNFSTRDAIMERAELFNRANQAAQAHGLQFGLHNHFWEFQTVDGQLAYDILLEQLDPSIFLELDIYWMQASNIDVKAYISKVGDRAQLLHVKDGPGTQDGMHVAVGQGNIDIAGCIEVGVSAEWLIVELDHSDGDMLVAVQESARYLIDNNLGEGR